MARRARQSTSFNPSAGLKPPKSSTLSVTGWSEGLNQMVDANFIQDNELAVAINVLYKQYGVLSTRPGQIQLGQTMGSTSIQALQKYQDTSKVTHLMAVIGGTLIEYNFSTSQWFTISGKTFKTTGDITLLPVFGAIYILDGVSNLTKWDNSVFTTQTPLTTPSGVTVTPTGTFPTNGQTISYRISAVSATGETLASASATQANCPVPFTSSIYVTVNWSAVSGASSYNIYRGTPGNERLLVNVTNTQLVDQGQYDSGQSQLFTPLKYDTSGGPIANYGALYHSVMFLNDPNNPSRVQYSGGGDKIDSFSAGVGGGWYDYNKHDGDALNAIFAFQDSLYLFKDRSIGSFAFGSGGVPLVSDVNHAIGAVGPKAIVAVEDDLLFFSRYGVYSLGNQPNFINVVRTAELSGKIHDGLIAGLASTAFSHICASYFNHVVLFSIPSGSGATNNTTSLAYNRLYLNWSEWRGIAVNNFIKYVDASNIEHLYAGRADGKFVELWQGTSDLGLPIYFNATTKIFDMGMPHKYKFFERINIQFANVNAQSLKITFIRDGSVVVKQFTINSSSVSSSGFGTEQFGTSQFGAATQVTNAVQNVSFVKYYELFKDYQNMQLIFEDTSTVDTFSIDGVYIEWQESERPLPSSSRLS